MSDDKNRSDSIWVNSFEESDVRDFYDRFMAMEVDESVSAIPIYIDTPGGSVFGLNSMVDLINSSTKPVATICVGKAMSAGATLLASGSKGLRFASQGSTIMVHEMSSGWFGKVADMESNQNWINGANKRWLKEMADNMGISTKELTDHMHGKMKNSDWYMTPRQAKKWGIIDTIGLPRQMVQPPASYFVIPDKQ